MVRDCEACACYGIRGEDIAREQVAPEELVTSILTHSQSKVCGALTKAPQTSTVCEVFFELTGQGCWEGGFVVECSAGRQVGACPRTS